MKGYAVWRSYYDLNVNVKNVAVYPTVLPVIRRRVISAQTYMKTSSEAENTVKRLFHIAVGNGNAYTIYPPITPVTTHIFCGT